MGTERGCNADGGSDFYSLAIYYWAAFPYSSGGFRRGPGVGDLSGLGDCRAGADLGMKE